MSGPLVTITLGRTGQVVKRSGTKRYVGSDLLVYANKRRRVDHTKRRSDENRFNDSWIAQTDLRLKLIRKRRVKEWRKRYSHEKLSKALQPLAIPWPRPQLERRSILRQYHSTKTLHAQTIDDSKIRSPDKVWIDPRNFDERRQVPAAIRAADVSRSEWILSHKVGSNSRQTARTAVKAKPVTPTGGIVLKNSHMGVESLTVDSLLGSLGLGKYAPAFQTEEVDMDTLRHMGDKDLQALRLPMGPRKKILLALQARSKRQPP